MADRYTITGQRQITQLGANGQFQQVMEISFEVYATGTTASVHVPLSRYSADNVKALIDAYVDNIIAVHEL